MDEEKSQPKLVSVPREETKEEEQRTGEELEIEDLREILAPQDFDAGVKKIYLHITVGRPKKHEFFKVRPGDEWTMGPVGIYREQGEFGSETYVIMPEMYEAMEGLVTFHRLYLAVTRQDKPYVWPVRLPDESGRDNAWHSTAREAVELAKKLWIRVVPNQDVGSYESVRAETQSYQPKWPDISFLQIINRAFKGRIVRDEEHPIVRKIRGVI
jgi:hypothetical protein